MLLAALELGAAQSLFAARMMVAALHDEGPWAMRWGPVTVPAIKAVTEDGVRFSSVFPEVCWLSPPEEGVLLLLDGDVLGIKRVDHPGDTEFVVTWELATAKVSV